MCAARGSDCRFVAVGSCSCVYLPFGSVGITKGCEIPKRFEAREKDVSAALYCGEGRQTGDFLADGTLGNFIFERAVLRADDRIALVTEFVKVPVISPYVL